jgi:quercetin dioxygenase-like cupin family protein
MGNAPACTARILMTDIPKLRDVATAGQILRNPVTGQDLVFRRTTADTGGEVLEVESIWHKNADEPVEHFHPSQEEQFEVTAGRLGARVDGGDRVLSAGDTLTVPAGTPHAMWNASDGETRAIWETRPALKTERFFETAWGLADAGEVGKNGVPGPLQLAVMMREYDAEFRLTKPPRPLQVAVFAVLAPIGRLLGRRAYRPPS